MDQVMRAVYGKHIEKAISGLKKNRFGAEYAETPQDLLARLSEMIPAGSSCSLGGSMTVMETGVKQWLEERSDLTYHDRYAEGADTAKVYHDALCCDFYLTSTNALTLNGELYNVDGAGNRVAALCYGPKKVIVITGYNKIVNDLDEARIRMKRIAAPANATRLSKKTPCVATGFCHDCASEDRICNFELVVSFQKPAERVHVFIMGDQYGY